MPTDRITLAEGVPTLRALGVEGPEELFERGGTPERRGEHVASGEEGRSALRFPLPGTSDASGRLTGKPERVGTGWVVLSRWRHAPLRALVRSRFTAPRSASLAEREWNLLCRLLDHGVGVPRPLAVGARGQGLFSRDSFLVTRELSGHEPLELWARADADPARRRRAASALGRLLAGVIRAGVVLPRLRVADLRIKPEPTGEFGASCDDDGPSVPGRLRLRRMPGVALAGVAGGLIRKELRHDEVRAMLHHLLEDASHLGLARPEEVRRVAALAVRGARERRGLWRALG